VLHLDQSDADVASAYNTLEQALASRGTNATGTKGEPFRLAAANALWGQNGQRFLDPFLDVLAASYGAGVNLVDFAGAPERARVTINDWVSDQTARKIPELLPKDSLDSSVRFVLTNAVYFNAAWAAQFQREATQDGTFTLADGSTAELPLMHEGLSTRYAEGTGWKATELPYSGGEVSMLLVLPEVGTFDAFRAGFDPKQLADIDAALAAESPEPVVVTLPRFEVRTPLSLADTLTALGMPTAFTSGADLSGIDGEHDLSIGDVIHQAYAKVDEEGTEAAAATAVIGVGSSAPTEPPPEPKHFDARQPFLFGIRDQATGALLFLGQISDPRG
jgi:serpin B